MTNPTSPMLEEGRGQGSVAGGFSYSAGNCESYHDESGLIAFRRGQSLYRRSWYLVVTDLAADFRNNHDGWECTWPLEFRIYEDGTEVARFDVECELEPSFSAYSKDHP